MSSRRDFLRAAGTSAAAALLARVPAHGAASRSDDDLDLSRWLQPVPPEAFFEDAGWCIWCGSMVAGDDGKFHLFYSRWPAALGHRAWVTHSEIARAVADRPSGPYRHVEVVLPARERDAWDGACTHNPTILRFGRKLYLYYMGNTGDRAPTSDLNWQHRSNQRIGVAVADSPGGPWTRRDTPLIDVSADPAAPDAVMVSNPSVCARPGGGYLMIYKAVAKVAPPPAYGPVVHLVASSGRPDGPFTKRLAPIFTHAGEHFPAEDPYVWHDGRRYLAIVKDFKGVFTGRGRSLALFESADGFDWRQARHPLVGTTEIARTDGTRLKLNALERPQLWRDARGEPAVLFCAGAYSSDRTRSFNVAIPLRRPA